MEYVYLSLYAVYAVAQAIWIVRFYNSEFPYSHQWGIQEFVGAVIMAPCATFAFIMVFAGTFFEILGTMNDREFVRKLFRIGQK